MRKNIASQTVCFQMVNANTGAAVTTGTPTVYVTGDNGTQTTGGGTSAHKGNGQWSYVPTQAETDYNHVAYTMVLTDAISQTVNLYPVSFNPYDGVRLGLTALPNAAADAAGGLPISDAGGLDLDAMNSNVSNILTDTAEIGAAGAGLTEAGGTGDHLTAVPWNASWDAEVQSECAGALTAYDPPTNAEMEARTLVAANYATAAALSTVDGNVDLILEDTGTTLPATLATIAGYIDTEIAGIISTLGTPAGISISADIAALPTAAENRAEIDSNSTQLAVIVADTNELQTNQGNWLTATGFSTHSAADVWSVPTRVLTANTNLNDPTAAQIRAEIDSNSTQLAAIKAVTDVIPDSGAMTSIATAAALATVDGNIDTIVAGVITGQAQTGTLSTTQATTNLSGYADDQLIGRVIIWTSGNCDGEATDITDYASASGLLTFTALTTAPANGDTFKIV